MRQSQVIYQKNQTIVKGIQYMPCLVKGSKNSYHVQYVRADKIKQ